MSVATAFPSQSSGWLTPVVVRVASDDPVYAPKRGSNWSCTKEQMKTIASAVYPGVHEYQTELLLPIGLLSPSRCCGSPTSDVASKLLLVTRFVRAWSSSRSIGIAFAKLSLAGGAAKAVGTAASAHANTAAAQAAIQHGRALRPPTERSQSELMRSPSWSAYTRRLDATPVRRKVNPSSTEIRPAVH